MRKKTGATHVVDFKSETDGVSSLAPADLHSFAYDIKCTNCGDLRAGVIFGDSEVEAAGSRGTFNFRMNCKCCGRQSTISYASVSLDRDISDFSEWNQLLALDCRGCDVVAAHCSGWRVGSESGSAFEWDGGDDFFEYDEDLERPVTVSELQVRVRRA